MDDACMYTSHVYMYSTYVIYVCMYHWVRAYVFVCDICNVV